MTLYDLFAFCQKNGVEVSLGFDPLTENTRLILRRGMQFQVEERIMPPDYFLSVDAWERIVNTLLQQMLEDIKKRERN